MFKLKNFSLIFDEGPIARAYFALFQTKNIKLDNLFYLCKSFYFTKKICLNLKYYYRNHYPIEFIKTNKFDYFFRQIEEYFDLEKNFIKSMYDHQNLFDLSNFIFISSSSINSKKLIKNLISSNSEIFINTGKQILNESLTINKKFLHIHPAQLPNIRGADGSLHSISKLNTFSSSAFFMDEKIDRGEIIFSEKKELIKFKLNNFADYTIKDLYRIWFAFVDPIIRVSNLNKLLIGVSLKINNDDKNIKDSKYYKFMNKKDLENCFQKVFC